MNLERSCKELPLVTSCCIFDSESEANGYFIACSLAIHVHSFQTCTLTSCPLVPKYQFYNSICNNKIEVGLRNSFNIQYYVKCFTMLVNKTSFLRDHSSLLAKGNLHTYSTVKLLRVQHFPRHHEVQLPPFETLGITFVFLRKQFRVKF